MARTYSYMAKRPTGTSSTTISAADASLLCAAAATTASARRSSSSVTSARTAVPCSPNALLNNAATRAHRGAVVAERAAARDDHDVVPPLDERARDERFGVCVRPVRRVRREEE